MEYSIYSYSLCISLTLMVFFAFYFFFAQTPDRETYANYLRSRRVMGLALLTLAANYCVHFFAYLRFSNPNLATFMNLSTYFLEAWLFSSALTSLLDNRYLTRRRFFAHLGYWGAYTAASVIAAFILPSGTLQRMALLFMALVFFVYAVFLARRLLIAYRCAVRAMDDYYSEDVEVYIRWMSRFTYWAAVFGVAVGGLTFLPEKYVFLWILSAIPFYIYLYVSYMNYLIFYERVQAVFDTDEADLPQQPAEELTGTSDIAPTAQGIMPACYDDLSAKLGTWTTKRGFTRSGITAAELAVAMESNRTYLTGYIKLKYGLSFRKWIGGLRIEYAKELLSSQPELSVEEIAKIVGYNSYPHFVNVFSDAESISPARWRRGETGKITDRRR